MQTILFNNQEELSIIRNIPEYVKDSMATDCNSVTEFARKYRKSDRFGQRGEDYVKAIMQRHQAELARFGYTGISRHDSVTGKFITYQGVN